MLHADRNLRALAGKVAFQPELATGDRAKQRAELPL